MNANYKISKRILNYLRKRPLAADTLEGITDWWLRSESVEHTVEEIAVALEGLIEAGSVIKVETENGRSIYRLAK